jgi:hypothetical protein
LIQLAAEAVIFRRKGFSLLPTFKRFPAGGFRLAPIRLNRLPRYLCLLSRLFGDVFTFRLIWQPFARRRVV